MRDKDYIWCEGTIRLIIEQINKEPLYVIHYDGMSHQWDEIIYKNSGRLAKHKTYTSIENIPKYKILPNKSIVAVENQILTTSLLQLNGSKERTPIDDGSLDTEMKDPNEDMDVKYDENGEQIAEENSDEGIEAQINTFLD